MSLSISKIQKRQRLRKLIVAVAAVATLGAGAALATFKASNTVHQTFARFSTDVDAGRVDKLRVAPGRESGSAEVALKDGKTYVVELPGLNIDAASAYAKKGIDVEINSAFFDAERVTSFVLMLVLLFGLGYFATRPEPMAMPFKSRRSSTGVRFADVAGADEAKRNLEEIAGYLKEPQAYEAIGAHFPRGVILHGDPGTGKTLLAKALAGEAGANFIATNGSDFGSMFIGVSSMKIKRLFARARSMAPCVLFIDEIDAVGGKRTDDSSAAGREMSSTLNQLLVQMDGFDANSGIIVVAATNRIDSLDPALLRSGRFDRRIQLGKPNLREREEILRIHARRLKVDPALDYHEVAKHSIGFSGADLANLMNQAALIAVRDRQPAVVLENVLRARNVMLMGEERRSTMAMLDNHTRTRLAYHECGHAIVAMAGNQNPVSAVSIVPRGYSLGQTFISPEKDTFLQAHHELTDRLNVLVAGRVAEEMFMGTITTGADDDIARATEIALNIVCRHGMSEFGMMKITEHSSPQMRYEAERRAAAIIEEARQNAISILRTNEHVMTAMSSALLEKEELDQEELREYKELVIDPTRRMAAVA